MKSPEQKVAQRFVVLAYKRYRMNRKAYNYFSRLKEIGIGGDSFTEWVQMNETWNHLQSAKKIYYEIIEN